MTAVLPFAATFSLPSTTQPGNRSHNNSRRVVLGGRDKSVAFFDCDNRFSASRLFNLLRGHIKSRIQEHCAAAEEAWDGDDAEMDALVRKCLARVHVFRPTSTESLAEELDSLPSYHASRLGAAGADSTEFIFVFVDSMSAFYWQDRYRVEQLSASSSSSSAARPQHPIRLVCAALCHVRKKLSPVIFLSNWALGPLTTAHGPGPGRAIPSESFYRAHLPSPYPAPGALPPGSSSFDPKDPLGGCAPGLFITHHLTLHPIFVPPFPRGTSLQDALKDTKRNEAVERAAQAQSICILRSAGVNGFNEIGRFSLDLPR
jgi:DNA-repair protein XRCC2